MGVLNLPILIGCPQPSLNLLLNLLPFHYAANRWYRDSYSAGGKHQEQERRVREVAIMPTTQILVALRNNDSFWFVPGSHNRANSEEEEARFEEKRTGSEEKNIRTPIYNSND